jgi:hypothetical protein
MHLDVPPPDFGPDVDKERLAGVSKVNGRLTKNEWRVAVGDLLGHGM